MTAIPYIDQVARANDPAFRARVEMAMVSGALVVAGEAKTGLDDVQKTKRMALAVAVLNDPSGFVDRFAWAVSSQNLTVFGAVGIASSTNSTPITVTTSTAHGLATGDTVAILGHAVNTNANGTFSVTVIDPTNFTINAAGNGVGATTGTVTKQCPDSDINTALRGVFNAVAGVSVTD